MMRELLLKKWPYLSSNFEQANLLDTNQPQDDQVAGPEPDRFNLFGSKVQTPSLKGSDSELQKRSEQLPFVSYQLGDLL